MKKIFATLWLGIPIATVYGGTGTGAITSIYVANGTVAFGLSTAIKDTPKCNESGRFAFDLGKKGSDSVVNILLAAKRENYTVSVQGLNTCVSEWKSEDVKSIVIK